MLTTTVKIPVTQAELDAQRAEETERAEWIARRNLFDANRKAGKREPRPGDKLHVATARGIKSRGRAGLVFSQKPTTVEVVDHSDDEVAAKQRAGATLVNPWGAEQILADANHDAAGLVLFAGASEAAGAALNVDAMSDEEAAALQEKLANRKARPPVLGAEKRIGGRQEATEKEGADARAGLTKDAQNTKLGTGEKPKGDKA